jgi:hypothetical protein
MLQSLRSCAISIAIASLLASGLRSVVAPASAASGAAQGQDAAVTIPVRYLISGPDLNGIELKLPASSMQVKVRLSANGSWYSCAGVGTVAHCETPGETVQALQRVEIANA